MRKFLILIFAAAWLLLLFGCNKQPAPTEPVTALPPVTQSATEPSATQPDVTQPAETEPLLEGATLYGIDVTGMTAQEAKSAIQNALSHYSLILTVNNREFQLSGETLSLTLSEDAFDSWFQQTLAGIEPSVSGLLSFDTAQALALVEGQLETSARNAGIAYDASTQQFQITPHRDGTSADLKNVKSALATAVGTLSPTATAYAKLSDVPATVCDTDPRLSAAVSDANEYLKLNLSYTYEAPGITATVKELSAKDMADFLSFDSNFQVQLNSRAIQNYVSGVGKQFGSTSGDFITTHGTTVGMKVDYYGAVLDQKAMYQDLFDCLKNKTSGNRIAPFLASSANNMPYGGNYVEIDLSSQYLWLYKNGELVISTPFVSGNVSAGRRTPTGVFSIFGMYTDTYLMGPTWYDYVNYWIPFYGGIGLHDASWRSEFGDSIYMYNGSHGCINLPNHAAGVIYDNVSIGTMVIVYGGVRSVSQMEQVLSGTTVYELDTNSSPFSLNIARKYRGVSLHYSSSDPNVVTVSESGVVTVVGTGTAQITVTSEAVGVLSEGQLVVTVTVTDPDIPDNTEPEESEPKNTEPEQTEPEATEPESTEPPVQEDSTEP